MKFCSHLKNTVAKPLGAIALASMAMLGGRGCPGSNQNALHRHERRHDGKDFGQQTFFQLSKKPTT